MARHPRFARGARRSPPHKLLATQPFRPVVAAPPQFGVVPKQLDMWGNSTYGDCVSAEEAFALAAYTTMIGLPEAFVPEATVVAWARSNGYLNGADLQEVMDSMRQQGFKVGSQLYNDGGYNGVDYSNESILQAALAVGPVKIAIDANALPSGAGNNQGWYATGGGNFPNTDHCVSLSGYGPASYLYGLLGVPVPSALANKAGYLLFTWSTIGFVDHAWLMGTCVEAYVRQPTNVGVPPLPSPTPPGPTPIPPGPTPIPPVPGTSILLPAGLYQTSGDVTFSPSSVTDPLGPLWASVQEIMAGDPKGWPDFVAAISALLMRHRDQPGSLPPFVLQIIDAVITMIGTSVGIPAAFMAQIIAIINGLLGADAAARFQAQHANLKVIQ